MANQTLIYNNLIDTATLSGGSWETTLPLSNIQNSVIRKVARTTDATEASSIVKIDLGANYIYFQAICLVGHNLGLEALWRITSSNVSDFSVLNYDSGWMDVYPSIYDSLSLNWEDANFWLGKAKLSGIDNYTRTLFHILTAITEARYIKIEISNTTNSDGYIQIGRIMIGYIIDFERNPDWGASISWVDDSDVSTALGGTRYFNKKDKRRIYAFDLSEMTNDEALNYALEMQRTLGITEEIFVILDPDNVAESFRTSFLGRLVELSPVERHVYAFQRTSFTIEEII